MEGSGRKMTPDPSSKEASTWAKDLQPFHAFVDRLSTPAFVAVVETSIVSIVYGFYLSFHPITESYRIIFWPSAFIQLGVGSFLLTSRMGRRKKLDEPHKTLSVSLIAVAIILNLVAAWGFWALVTKG